MMDVQKLAYDLSLIYTKVQYEKALIKKTIPEALNHPQYLEESSFLAETFSTMYIELLNSPGLFTEIQEVEPTLLDNNE